ncbi:MAG: hypothetical protein HUU26_13355 [Gemmatimonadaceae bacterium]|nr:hypothetical protein [Gemmatimonadaceae bacterium]
MRVIDLLGAQPQMSDEDAEAVLVQGGVGAADAFLLIRLVPCGLAFAMLKRMGLTKLPSTYAVVNAAGEWVQLPLATEHYFSTALARIIHEPGAFSGDMLAMRSLAS